MEGHVVAGAGTVLGGHSAADVQRMLRAIAEATERVERLLGGLAALTREGGGRAEPVRLSRTDLTALVEDIRQDCAREAGRQGRRLDVRLAQPLPAVMADAARIREVLTGLVANALKVTPRGGAVTLEAEPRGTWVRCAVRDEGPGMTAREADWMFDPYWQADHAAGLALGLKIAKCVVEAHGGAMCVKTRPGAGATVAFTLPVAPVRAEPPEAAKGLQ